ncbi:MAG TPA: 2-succinyl-6-hydroxy-2,4-cyclohexadiene-1-carboxylate synthase [Chloroflexota bacterium]|jgi:2-succinyl-6-hydroxy-2,4-cyclohexadiene-1-carboxylate synthase
MTGPEPPRVVSDLHVEIWGEGAPLLLLHGFTGSAATWAPLRGALGAGRRLIAVDLLGHGASPSPPDPADYAVEREVERLVGLLDRLSVERTSALGYSMGGRIALQLALAHPERIERLVLESTSPGIGDPVERASRARSDGLLADLLEHEGIEPFVDRWERVPLFASQARLPAERRETLRADRLRRDPLGLANSLRGAGQGAAPPVLDRLGELTTPTLLIVGALDERYVALGRLMVERIADAELVVVPEAGHATHLERPAAFEAAVVGFCARATSRCHRVQGEALAEE